MWDMASNIGILGNNRRRRAIEVARAIFKRCGRAVELQPQSVAAPSRKVGAKDFVPIAQEDARAAPRLFIASAIRTKCSKNFEARSS
jgi:hypothetical protein